MMNTNRTLKLTTLALCGVINILGGTIALLLRLPVYLDSIGTVLAAALFGPAAGLVPGLISGLISGMTSDVYAFYYIPVQLVIGLVAGLVFGGITSSGSTVLVQLLHSLGMNLTLSVCVVQAMTDFVDRMIVLAVVLVILPAVSSAFGSLSMRSRK